MPHDIHDFMGTPMLKMVGTSGQVSLGKQYAGRYFEVELQTDGSILLKPMRVMPEADAWLYTPAMRERLVQADAWMANNPPCESDLEQFAAKLDGQG